MEVKIKQMIAEKPISAIPEPAWIVTKTGEAVSRNGAAIAFDSISSLSIFTRLSNIDFQLLTVIKQVAESGKALRLQPVEGILTKGFVSVYPQSDETVLILFLASDDTNKTVNFPKRLNLKGQIRFSEIFRSFFELNPNGLIIEDRDGKIINANPAAGHILGLPHDELAGLYASDFISPEYWPSIVSEFRAQVDLDKNDFSISEVPCKRIDDERFTAEIKLSRIWADGKLYVLVHIEDRTETYKMLHQAHESDTAFRQIFDNTPVAIVMWDTTGEIQKMNPAAQNLFAIQEKSTAFTSIHEMLLEHSDPNDFLPDITSIYTGERFLKVAWHYFSANRVLELESSFLPQYTANEEINGGIMITRDATATNKSMRDWRRRNQQLAQLLDSVSRLSAQNELKKVFDSAIQELSRLGLYKFVVGFLFPTSYQLPAMSIIHATADHRERTVLEEHIREQFQSGAVEQEFVRVLQPNFEFGNCYLFQERDVCDEFPLMSMLSQFPVEAQENEAIGLFHDLLSIPIKDRNNATAGVIVLSQPIRASETFNVEQAHIFELFSRIIGGQLDLLRLNRQTISAEQRYHSLIDQLGDGVIVTDPDETIVIVNPATTQIVGYSNEELVGHSALMLFPDEQHQVIAEANIARRKKIASSYESIIRRGDGTLRTVKINATPFLDEHGEYSGSLALLTDITERRSNENALRQAYEELAANNQFASLLATRVTAENIEQKILQGDTATTTPAAPGQAIKPVVPVSAVEGLEDEALQLILETVSAEHGAVLIFDPEQMRVRNVTVKALYGDPIDTSKIEALGPELHKVMREGKEGIYCSQVTSSEYLPKKLIKHIEDLGIRSFAIHSLTARKSVLGILFIGHSDPAAFSQSQLLLLSSFSEQLSLALDNTRLLQALLRASSNWVVTFDAIPDPIFVLASNGTVRRLNKSASKLFGGQIRELIGHRLDEYLGEFGQHLLELPSSITELEETHLIRNKRLTYSITIIPISPTERLVMLRDITESRFLQEQMIESQRRELVIRFAGGIAHDFNNLLVGIMGTADLMTKRIGDKSPHLPLLRVILESAKRAAELVRQLLAYARGGSTQVVSVDINEIVKEVQQLLRVTMSPNIDITLQLNPVLPRIAIDDTQLQQIVMNLGINASEALGGKGQITFQTGYGAVSPELEHNEFDTEIVWLRVFDNGPGFPPQILEHPGEPFNSTKGTGRGLGLAAVFGIVARHNGKIYLSNRPNAGACVTIAFASISDEAKHIIPAAPKEVYHEPWSVTAKKVLIVDDEEMVRTLTRDVLESIGFTVDEAGGGEDGLHKLSTETYDLLLLDIVMPRMSGIDVYHALREFNKTIPVLFVSGYDESDMVAQLSDTKLSFQQKPFMVDDLIDKVHAILTE